MAGHFTHYAVTGYASVCATCTLSASATVQVAHTLAHPLNSYKKVLNSEIYIDKTDMLDFFNKVLDTKQQYICVSRPRRFGKSITANTIAAYFEKGCDSRPLFEGRKLSEYDN